MRVVVALGGNALLRFGEKGSFEEQIRNVKIACKSIVELVKRGYQIAITHGNGPQVGNLAIQQECTENKIPPQPLHVLVAMTQGQIGYMIQQTLHKMLRREGLNKQVVTVITQVLVDRKDPAFKNPTKPIGPFYTREEAEKLALKRGYYIKRVLPSGERVYRRVVPSPDPKGIVEGEVIKRLVDSGVIVVASGGGGIPVVESGEGEYEGVDAVIDKDLASEKLAEAINADTLLILTDVEKVKLYYGTPKERDIDIMSILEAKKYLREGHFLPGSMEPKVRACIRFLEWGGEKAIITSLEKTIEAIEEKTGTHIVP